MYQPLGSPALPRRSSLKAFVAGTIALVMMALALLAAPKPAQAFGSMSFPVAVISASNSFVPINYQITFDGSQSYGLEMSIPQRWDWDFGDGTTATGVTAQHSYATPGNYTVKLTVTDQFGVTGSTTAPAIIWIYPTGTVQLTPTTGNGPLTVNGDASSFVASPGRTLVSYTWNWGDGTTSSGVTASHTYATPGAYLVRLTVMDSFGFGGGGDVAVTVTQPMAAPTNLAATSPTRGSVTLKWTNRMTTTKLIEVQRCAGSKCTSFVTVNYLPGTSTTAVDSGLRSGSTFRYRLKVTDIANAVGYSNLTSIRVR